MKVLIAFSEDHGSSPFVRTLKKGLEEVGCDINWGLEEFWNYTTKYDIINIQFPDSLFKNWSPTELETHFLERHLSEVKKYSKIVYTRHNEIPHYTNDTNRLKCYEIVERNADVIVHLGSYSVEKYKKRPNNEKVKHVVISHHIYDREFDNTISQRDARIKLNIPLDKFVILTFGVYRDIEEANMVLSEYRRFNLKNKLLLAPRLGDLLFRNLPNNFGLKSFVEKALTLRLKLLNVKYSNEYVEDNHLHYYFAATDVVLVQRKKILNSGNVPMAFFYKKPVIGANTGNVGEILKQTNNILFDPYLPGDLCRAFYDSINISKTEIGLNNYHFAIQNMNIKDVAKQYYELFVGLAVENEV